MHPERLAEVQKFKPLRTAEGTLTPRRVFVNSMSDLWHADIPDEFIDDVFQTIEKHPYTIFVCLTKRALRLKDYGERRWRNGVPENVWLGVTAENNQARGRIDQLRALKDAVGDFTAYVNVEPLLEHVFKQDYTAIDWVGVGGEAGTRARRCEEGWIRHVVDSAHNVGAAVWFKSWGRWENNPSWGQAEGRTKKEKKQNLVDRNLEWLPEEHGGATLDGGLVQELPPSFERVKSALNKAAD